ncbi:transposon, putative [Talaromyces stipitatus ATCC 10500]|uniref:Transposon, putative n=1 Tax=Talaromyces stipitatus (strain ATCC 10500 / CBS 375.48 / QM 6759 / NRRL 1006) TaxID=441959 RepID=B8MCK1_TALSN|nr:transposon, putative [Talaromyces stipitatus ATCC 10500]EED18817.1 transposon, putative [Talaromyces stipitatus ATCC 10500]
MAEPSEKKHRNAILNSQKAALRAQYQLDPKMGYKALAQWFEEKYHQKINIYLFLDEMQGQTVSGKRIRPENWPELESALSEWIRRAKNQDLALSHEIIRQKAKQFWPTIYPGKPIPQFSNGWLERFQSRQEIKIKKQHGDTGDSAEDATLQMVRIRQLLRTFTPRDIFSCDETGLFWKMIPERNLSTRVVPGRQNEQARISVLFCCNSDGTERLPPLFIGTHERPAAFAKANINIENLCCLWRSNGQAWMTSDIFKEWLLWFDSKMEGRKVVLLLDKFSAHQIAAQKVSTKLQNTLILWLPACPEMPCPLVENIIDVWKIHWKREWLRYMNLEFGRDSDPTVTMTILMAVRWAITAWNVDLDPQTVVHYFRKALEVGVVEEINHSHLINNIAAGLENLRLAHRLNDIMDVNEYLNCPDEKVNDGIIDIDSIVLSQFLRSGDIDEEDDGPEVSIPLISTSDALQSLYTLRLYEEQQDVGDRELIMHLMRFERILQARLERQYQGNLY